MLLGAVLAYFLLEISQGSCHTHSNGGGSVGEHHACRADAPLQAPRLTSANHESFPKASVPGGIL